MPKLLFNLSVCLEFFHLLILLNKLHLDIFSNCIKTHYIPTNALYKAFLQSARKIYSERKIKQNNYSD